MIKAERNQKFAKCRHSDSRCYLRFFSANIHKKSLFIGSKELFFRKFFFFVLSLILVFAFLSNVFPLVDTVSAYAGGDGSSGNPYQITHIEHLYAIRNNLSECFILMNDLDFDDDDSYLDTSHKAGNISGSGWLPIGASNPYFTGTFDGNNCTISVSYTHLRAHET